MMISSSSSSSSPVTKQEAQPPQSQPQQNLLTPVIWCILVTETGERFAYYGFRAILVLYFTMELDYSETQAISLFAYTTALAYFSPILGALLADGSWGRYQTILIFGAIYVVGLLLLTYAAAAGLGGQDLAVQRFWTMIGLLLVCLGTGGIKPCVSSFGADQVGATSSGAGGLRRDDGNRSEYKETLSRENDQLLNVQANNTITIDDNTNDQGNKRDDQVRAFFAYFYFCINVGALSSIAVIPILRGRFGFGISFLVPTLFMLTAMLLFVSMRKSYVHHVPGQDGTSLATTFRLCWWLVKKYTWSRLPPWMMQLTPTFLRPGPQPLIGRHHQSFSRTLPTHDHDSNEGNEYSSNTLNQQQLQLSDAKQALRVLPILALLPIFWCLYDQQGSVWTLQATKMELNGLQPEQLNVVNPLQIMILIPLFDKCVYPWLTLQQINIQPLRRMSYGMVLASLAFFASGLVETAIEKNATKISVFWQLPQITLLSIAEILVSVTGLEFAYATSPDRLKAFLMALFLLTTAIGDLLSGVLYSTVFATMNRAVTMHICGTLMLMNLVVFAHVAQGWGQRSQNNTAGSEEDDDPLGETPVEGIEFQENTTRSSSIV